jgi:hypothetical protein
MGFNSAFKGLNRARRIHAERVEANKYSQETSVEYHHIITRE